MNAYVLFAILQIIIASGCLYVVTRLNMAQSLTTLVTGLTGLVWFGASLRIALDVFRSDFAFYMHSYVFPFASGAMVSLLILTGIFFCFRLVSGQKL